MIMNNMRPIMLAFYWKQFMDIQIMIIKNTKEYRDEYQKKYSSESRTVYHNGYGEACTGGELYEAARKLPRLKAKYKPIN